jgi:hypothetical protein
MIFDAVLVLDDWKITNRVHQSMKQIECFMGILEKDENQPEETTSKIT